MNRELDGVYFRVQRDGKWQAPCFSDLTEEERERVCEGRSAEWCDVFDCRVNELIDMFDDDFDFSVFDFSGDDITSKIATLIYESKLQGR